MSPTYVLKSCPKQRTWNAQTQWQRRLDKPRNGAEKLPNVSTEIPENYAELLLLLMLVLVLLLVLLLLLVVLLLLLLVAVPVVAIVQDPFSVGRGRRIYIYIFIFICTVHIYIYICVSPHTPRAPGSWGRQSRRGAREARQLHRAPRLHCDLGPGQHHRGSVDFNGRTSWILQRKTGCFLYKYWEKICQKSINNLQYL